jgi:hypothetical protein
MRITVLSYIGAEEDIVEQFVRHTLGFADKMRIVSTVNGLSREILHTLQQEGLAIDVIDHAPAYHDQHEMLTRLLQQYYSEADWFLPIDADEFVIGDIRTALMHADPQWLRALRWRTYVPTRHDNNEETNILKRIRHRRSFEAPQFTKIVIPSLAIGLDTEIGQGNHTVRIHSGAQKEGNWGIALEGVHLAHFPVRSPVQMQQKIARAWPAVARNPAHLPSEAFHWKQMYERYADRPLSADDLTEIALRYSASADAPLPDIVEDPVV